MLFRWRVYHRKCKFSPDRPSEGKPMDSVGWDA